MENELFMSMLPTWHSQEILSPEQYSSGDCNLSSSLVDKAAADHNPLIKLNSHIFHPPVKNDNSLIKQLMGKMALNSSAGNLSPIPQVSSFSGRPSRFCPNRSEGRKDVETEDQAELSSSHEDRILEGGEMCVDLKKRKSALRLKVAEVEDDSNTKRSKQLEDSRGCKCKEEDYIHVRARRGQATDSHSLAERMRREKIGARMKILQNLVPGCNKVTGKAVKLDEIINYVQSLQRQVQFLTMKLSCMNSVGNGSNGNFNVETQVQNPPHNLLPLNSSNGSTIKGPLHLPHFPPMASDRTNHRVRRRNEGVKVQYNDLSGDELRKIVKTGYGAYMKIEH